MQPIRAVFATLLVGSLASIAAVSWAAQEPKPEDRKPAETRPAAKPQKADKSRQDQDKKQMKDEQKDQRASHDGRADNRGGGRRIPDKDFHAHFGQAHKFKAQRVITTTNVVVNQTRFAYSGYTFVFLEPWPAGWLLTDDCYIDYVDGGYYLLDPFHPGIQVSLNVVQ